MAVKTLDPDLLEILDPDPQLCCLQHLGSFLLSEDFCKFYRIHVHCIVFGYIFTEVYLHVVIYHQQHDLNGQVRSVSKNFFKQSVRERKKSCHHGSYPGEKEEGSFPPKVGLFQMRQKYPRPNGTPYEKN